MKISLPDEAWADLREPEKVPDRLRRPIILLSARLSKPASEQDSVGVLERDMATMLQINDATIVALVAQWSFDFPVSLESLQDLPGDVYDALQAESAKHMTRLMPSFGVDPDPASPTEPSSD